MHRLLQKGALLFIVGATACRAPVIVPAPVPVTPPAVAAPVEAPAVFRLPILSTAAARMEVRSTVVSFDSARRDSSGTISTVLLTQTAGGSPALIVTASRPSVAGISDSLPAILLASPVLGEWNRAAIALPCREPGAAPSPLVVRLLVPRASATWPVRDSLVYSSCSGGARRTTRAVVTWEEPIPASDQLSYDQRAVVTGTVTGDSTRAFPMRLSGTITGEARLRVSAPSGEVQSSGGAVVIALEAEANVLRQRATQRLAFTARKQP